MSKKQSGEKVGIKDIVAFAKSGWTPSEVNALLDRMDKIGDITEPDPIDDDNDLEDIDDNDLEDINDEIDDPEVSDTDESDEDEEDNDTVDVKKKSSDTKKKNQNQSSLLEAENTRLKNEIAKMQAKNRSKDVSKDSNKSIESSLIDTFQSLFE